MKKIFWVLSIAVATILGSCTKDWTCGCTDSADNRRYYDIPNSTWRDAKHTCNAYEYNNGGAFNNCALIPE